MFLFQPNIERKPLKEMLTAEEAGVFSFKASPEEVTSEELVTESAEQLANRLLDLEIGQSTSSVMSPLVPEKVTNPASTTRPLIVDDDDLDLDLEYDENIDTTVSLAKKINNLSK